MTADKSAAAWHPGDGPVKPLGLDAIRARADAATSGPWVVHHENAHFPDEADVVYMTSKSDFEPIRSNGSYAEDSGYMSNENAEFIAHAREDIPALLAALAAEKARADSMTQLCDTNIESAQLWKARADEAEQRIADAPHEELCLVNYGGNCDCWKSAAPTTEQNGDTNE